jgi:signal transduction histidine kinase
VKRLVRPSLGLLGRLIAILLLTTLIEFGASTLLYERASQFSVQDDEARRLAEHLVISRRLVAERPPGQRALMAADLSTDRYGLRWQTALPPPPPIAPSLDRMRRQVVAWEPSLAAADLRLALISPGRSSVVTGGLKLPDGSWLYFRTLEPVHGLNLATERVLLALIPAIALLLLGGTLIRRALLPLRRLALAADRFGGGVPERVPEQGPADVARVVAAFNRMGARIHQLLGDRTQALAAVGHDLRTPLARLRLRTDAVAGDVAEMEAMIGSLLAYLGGESDPEPPARTDVAVLCATLVDRADDAGHDVDYIGPDHLEAVVRASDLKRAVGNLLDNALHYGTAATLTLIDTADALVIRVEDDGTGIPAHELARVMEPFVRLDDARGRNTEGFGLGLAIVRRLIEAEGGTVTLANRPEGGLRAELTLPRT